MARTREQVTEEAICEPDLFAWVPVAYLGDQVVAVMRMRVSAPVPRVPGETR